MGMHIREFNEADTERVVQLWRDCGLVRDWNDPYKDIARKLVVQRELFVVGVVDGEVVASAMAGYDGHRGSVNYLAVDPSQRSHGFGHELMAHLEARLTELGCPKLNLQVRVGNESVLDFYAAQGYAVDAVVSISRRLIPDN